LSKVVSVAVILDNTPVYTFVIYCCCSILTIMPQSQLV